MNGRLTKKTRTSDGNVQNIPKQSGVYLLFRGQKKPYVGSAGAGNLQQRIQQQLNIKRGITSMRYRLTSSEAEARKLEAEYRDRYNPEQKNI